MGGRDLRLERCPVHQFEGPGPNVQEDAFTSSRSPTLSDTAEADMCERAAHVGIDLDCSHVLSLGSRTAARTVGTARHSGSVPARPQSPPDRHFRRVPRASTGVTDWRGEMRYTSLGKVGGLARCLEAVHLLRGVAGHGFECGPVPHDAQIAMLDEDFDDLAPMR